MNWQPESEPTLRLATFVAVFGLMALWEALAPRRVLPESRGSRWTGNLGIFVAGVVVGRLAFPAAAVGVALLAERHDLGLFRAVGLPPVLAIVTGVILLDLVIWAQHRLFHAVPLLWRLHRMHHADTAIDVTTGIRFHPLEILLSLLIKAVVVVALGVPVLAVLIFEVLLNATSMFNHSNVRLAVPVDRWLRWLLVTPDMHRVHHSWHRDETNSNFGFNLPWWDRLFGTYRAQPRDGHEGMTIGLGEFRDPAEQRVVRLLTQPFRPADPQ